MPVVIPDGNAKLSSGVVVRISLVSIARNFKGFKGVGDGWQYMKGYYNNQSLVSAVLYENGYELIKFTQETGENTMGLLNNARNANRNLIPTVPFADKAALAARKETFTIKNVRARMSGISNKIEYRFLVELAAPSISYAMKDDAGVTVTPTSPVTEMYITQEANPFRDSVVGALCEAMNIDFAAMIEQATKDATDDNKDIKPYGPAILVKVGKAFDIADFEPAPQGGTYDPAKPF